jgi:hypothetical protein
MAQKNELIEQMLEHLVNDDQVKAEELFHEYVVAKSREIYEGLIESEMPKDEEEDEEGDDDDERKDESFDDEVAVEAPEMDDETDDLEMELDAEMDDEDEDDDMEEKSEEELFQDLDAIVDELQAKFDELKGSDMDDMGSDEEMKDEFELETVREYVEKVPAGHGAEKKGQAEKADGSSSGMKFSKNDMGGTSANIISGRNGSEGSTGGALKGNGLLKGNPQDMKTGNINVPGGKAGGAFSKKEPGHGAEKKGQAEGSTDGQSLFRGRR